MNLHALLKQRQSAGNPIRVGLIGAGKFGSMYLSQAKHTPGIHLVAVADLSPERAKAALVRVGWEASKLDAPSFAGARASGQTHITSDTFAMITAPELDVIIDATGSPAHGIAHVLACCNAKKHIVMVNVEADALAGPLLARRAREAGVVYSLAYGDQPALVCEMVDWCRAAGFEVVAAGKGTKYLPQYHESTPATVWPYYGIAPEDAAQGGMNPQMFNSFLDGTKSAIEMTSIANACGLEPPRGLLFPPCGVDDLAHILRPREVGGLLDRHGMVEVISSVERDGRPVFRDLRWGVYVVFRAGSDAGREYVRRCFKEYGLVTDKTGEYTAMYKPYHLIGLELGISVASTCLRGEPTGAPLTWWQDGTLDWRADVVATAKRALKAGETLDGEGGFTVYGKIAPASESVAVGALPLGLAHGCTLKRAIAAHERVCWNDVQFATQDDVQQRAIMFRREMEALS